MASSSRIVCNLHISKSKKVSTSNWEEAPLADKQLKYAVQDAWLGLTLLDVCFDRGVFRTALSWGGMTWVGVYMMVSIDFDVRCIQTCTILHSGRRGGFDTGECTYGANHPLRMLYQQHSHMEGPLCCPSGLTL